MSFGHTQNLLSGPLGVVPISPFPFPAWLPPSHHILLPSSPGCQLPCLLNSFPPSLTHCYFSCEIGCILVSSTPIGKEILFINHQSAGSILCVLNQKDLTANLPPLLMRPRPLPPGHQPQADRDTIP